MKILSAISKVNILVILFISSVFSQKGNDTVRIVDVKSFMEPYQNKNPDTIAYMFVQQVAVFPGGRDSLTSYVKHICLEIQCRLLKIKR